MEYNSDYSNGSYDSDSPNHKNTSQTDVKLENANNYTFSNKSNSKVITTIKEKTPKPDVGMNEDNAIEIIEVEFEEMKEWIKFKTRYLKRECTDIIESIKLQKQEINDYY